MLLAGESVEELDWICEKENYSYIKKDAVIQASKGLTYFP
jgi:hypothetical protein